MNSSVIPPAGCSSSTNPKYFTLCDLNAVWGIVVEAVASAGIFTSAVLLVVMVSSLPFIKDGRRKSMFALQASFLIFSVGLFGLSFAFLVGPDSITCTARIFVFGVLFAGCFACLLMHGLWLAILDRTDKSPQGWLFCLGALGLWLVEVIINTEWIIIIQMPQNNTVTPQSNICDITNTNFTLALIYVMVLLVSVVLMAVPSVTHKFKPFRQDALYIILTGILSICVWMVWIVLYMHINKVLKHPDWDEATLAIALIANGWVFLMMYVIPEICVLTQETKNVEVNLENHWSSSRSRVYENILRGQLTSRQGIGLENKAFSIQELNKAAKLVSPYSEYNGQVRSRVYQATELALISRGPMSMSHKEVLPRTTALPQIPDSSLLPTEG